MVGRTMEGDKFLDGYDKEEYIVPPSTPVQLNRLPPDSACATPHSFLSAPSDDEQKSDETLQKYIWPGKASGKNEDKDQEESAGSDFSISNRLLNSLEKYYPYTLVRKAKSTWIISKHNILISAFSLSFFPDWLSRFHRSKRIFS
ncbi:unnamed protein product [Gongylonema pulchrum]|uniref:Uncharacterized protein n=1 Tax=Gongylonema pulchrum TaxID=637853 RepID=A0A183DJA1_9BILA|nr:unnamed protein product [Gongylonema pulchrum]